MSLNIIAFTVKPKACQQRILRQSNLWKKMKAGKKLRTVKNYK